MGAAGGTDLSEMPSLKVLISWEQNVSMEEVLVQEGSSTGSAVWAPCDNVTGATRAAPLWEGTASQRAAWGSRNGTRKWELQRSTKEPMWGESEVFLLLPQTAGLRLQGVCHGR